MAASSADSSSARTVSLRHPTSTRARGSAVSLGVAAFFDMSLAAKTTFAGVSLLWFATTTVASLRIRQGRVSSTASG